jgi:ElaA protein
LISITWTFARLDDLTPRDVYDMLALRNAVFGVEQNCIYQDVDGIDLFAWHLLGRDAAGGLQAYLRLVDPGKKYAEPSIGRVIARSTVRGTGTGTSLMREGLARCEQVYGSQHNRIGAQAHLEPFYGRLGYARVSENYLEDGIPHVEMLHP